MQNVWNGFCRPLTSTSPQDRTGHYRTRHKTVHTWQDTHRHTHLVGDTLVLVLDTLLFFARQARFYAHLHEPIIPADGSEGEGNLVSFYSLLSALCCTLLLSHHSAPLFILHRHREKEHLTCTDRPKQTESSVNRGQPLFPTLSVTFMALFDSLAYSSSKQ